jgi:hypothetical protein
MTNRATKYANRIQSPRMRAYALAYIAFLQGVGPEPRPMMVGTSKAAAVRQNVRLELAIEANTPTPE